MGRDQNSAGRYPLISRPMQISTRVGVVQAMGFLQFKPTRTGNSTLIIYGRRDLLVNKASSYSFHCNKRCPCVRL